MVQQQVRRSGVFGAAAVALNLIGRFMMVGRVARALRPALRLFAGVTLVGILFSLAVISCYFLAGLLAARRARRIEPGIFAGLIAGSIAGLETLALTLIGTAMARHGLRMGVIGGIGSPRLAVAVFAAALVRMVASAAVGTGVGALGALVGRPKGGAEAAGWGYPYQAGPISPGAGAGSVPGAMPYSSGAADSSQTPLPTRYPLGNETPTTRTDSTPPTP
jgi:hypothetical protein